MPRRRAAPRLPHGARLPRARDLLPAERELVAACRIGERAVVGTGEQPTERTDANHIRAHVLRTLCLGTDPAAPIHEMGVRLRGAWIDGSLDLEAATLQRRLVLENCRIDGKIVLRHATTVTVTMPGTRCAGVTANSLRCRGDLNLRDGFSSKGEVDLRRATIEGDLNCRAGRFEKAEKYALSADGAEIGGHVFLDTGFHASGEVRLLDATIGGVLECSGGRFENAAGNALSADRAGIGGDVFLDTGFHATGTVRLLGATIAGDLACPGGRFENAEGDALSAHGAEIGGHVFLRTGFHATGTVHLHGATIGGNLECRDGRFDRPDGIALVLDNAEVAGTAFFDRGFEATGALRLAGASIATVFDEAEVGPTLVLDGFTCTRFGPGAACDATSRIAWLKRQRRKDLDADFKPQPWEQCAAVLAAMGHEDEARTIRIEKRRHMRRARLLRATTRADKVRARVAAAFDRLLDLSIGYGWRPLRPAYALLVVWIAAGFAYAALPPGIMAPTDPRLFLDPSIPPECRADWVGLAGPMPPRADDESRRRTLAGTPADEPPPTWKVICGARLPSEYSAFQPAFYALDVLLPVVDLRQERDWAPRVTDADGNTLHPIGSDSTGWGWGYVARLFEWGLIAFGWIASLLLVAGVTGVVRRD